MVNYYNYKIWSCTPKKNYYYTKKVRLDLLDKEDSIIATATLNISDNKLTDTQIVVKNHGDNIGIIDFLQKNNIVGPTIRTINVGLHKAHVVELLV